MKVKALADALATTPDTVRYYTRLGLLTPTKNSNGYKSYSANDMNRLRFILSARKLGFTVDDIKQIIAQATSGESPCSLVRSLIKQRLEETEQQFQAMVKLRQTMQNAMLKWQDKPNTAPSASSLCHLIDSFDDDTFDTTIDKTEQ